MSTHFVSILLNTADDPSLGRVNREMLSDQSRMELLVAGFQDTKAFRNRHEDFLPIEEWDGVCFNTEHLVEKINWNKGGVAGFPVGHVSPGGSIDVRWLPLNLLRFDISSLEMHGSMDTSALPHSLVRLSVCWNKLTGEFPIESLPCRLEHVLIRDNCFYGPLNIPALPKSTCEFLASSNEFSGTLDLSKLPENLRILDLNTSCFSGSIDLRNIPPELEVLSLYGNLFEESTLVVGTLPESLIQIEIDYSRASVVDTDGNFIETRSSYGYRRIVRQGN